MDMARFHGIRKERQAETDAQRVLGKLCNEHAPVKEFVGLLQSEPLGPHELTKPLLFSDVKAKAGEAIEFATRHPKELRENFAEAFLATLPTTLANWRDDFSQDAATKDAHEQALSHLWKVLVALHDGDAEIRNKGTREEFNNLVDAYYHRKIRPEKISGEPSASAGERPLELHERVAAGLRWLHRWSARRQPGEIDFQ